MRSLHLLALTLSIASFGCGSIGQYTWVNDLPAEVAPSSHEYRIHAGDIVSIQVFQQDAMSVSKARVRNDGRIGVPILGDIVVRDKRPSDLKTELEASLKNYVVTPHVNVTIDEAQPIQVSVMGEVGRNDIYILEPTAGVAQALAKAGGPTDYADRDRVFVVRGTKRIRFTYQAILRGEGRAANFTLQTGDLVVVE
jgi:polysaccharide export outer membrane protein